MWITLGGGIHPRFGAREDLSPLAVRGYARDVALFLDWYTPNKLEKLSAVDLIPTLTAAMTVENIFCGH